MRRARCQRLVPARNWCRVRLPGIAASSTRAAAPARQEDAGDRDPARCAGSGTAKKTAVAVALVGSGRHAMKTVADTLGVARSNLAVQGASAKVLRRRGRPPQPD